MKKVTVRQLFRDTPQYLNQPIQVSGWIRTLRDAKTLGFIELNDGSFFKNLQVVFDESLPGFAEILKLGTGAAVTVQGTLVESPGAKQPFETAGRRASRSRAKRRRTTRCKRSATPLNTCAPSPTCGRGPTPSPRSSASAPWPRMAIHQFFQERGFVYVHTPIITGSDCEGAGEMFRVTTLDLDKPPRERGGRHRLRRRTSSARPANLTVSGQLNAEAYALAFRNVYTFGPTFRAENSNTPRHAAEFWMIEPEMAFADLQDDMRLAEDMVKYLFDYVLTHAPEEMEFFNAFIDQGLLERLQGILGAEFARVTYTEAVKLLEAGQDRLRLPGAMGRRPPDRARALPDRAGLQAARSSSPTTPRRSRPSTCG